jgi:hypothetical protein
MGCTQSQGRSRRKRRRAKGRTRSKDSAAQREVNLSENRDGDSYPEYQEKDFEEEQQGVINKQEAMLEHPPTRYPSQYQSNTENMAIDTEYNPSVEHINANVHQMSPGGRPHPPAGTSEIPVAQGDYIAPYNEGQNIPEPAHNFVNPVNQADTSAPEHVSTNGAVTNKSALVYEEVSRQEKATDVSAHHSHRDNGMPRKVTEISATNVDQDNALRPADIGEHSQHVPAHQQVNTTSKRSLESTSKHSQQVDVEQKATVPTEVVTVNYKVPPTSEIE